MTTYYLSSQSGNDSNSGTSASQAWSNFSKLTGLLKAGDTVLLENGSDFKQTLTLTNVKGTLDLPITISNYGTGDLPTFSSTGMGINAGNSHYIVVENIAFRSTGDIAINAFNANNWIVQNVTFDNAATISGIATVNWKNSNNILFENNSVTNSHGDGIFMNNVTNVVIKDNLFQNVIGATADNVQISGTDVVISGNIMVSNPDSNTTKGNLVFQGSDLYAHDNYMQGGSFGASISANNVVIDHNVIKDHTKYSWSSDIILSDEIVGDVVSNIKITDNHLSDSYRNITIDGQAKTAAQMFISDLEISNNKLDDWIKAPVVINGAVIGNGTYSNNTTDKDGGALYATNSNVANLLSNGNLYIPDLPVLPPPPKTITITASADLYSGSPILYLFVNGKEVGHQDITALRSQGEKQTLTFSIPTFQDGDQISIKYMNDKINTKTGEDRNLYLHSLSMDGEAIKLKGADFIGKVFNQKDGSGFFFSSTSEVIFKSDDVPQKLWTKIVEPPPIRLEDVLESDHHVIFYDLEAHTVGSSSYSSAHSASFNDISSAMDNLHAILNPDILY